MAYIGHGMMIEDLSSIGLSLQQVLVDQHGWTLLTAISLMLFSLLHNPCSTTMLTIYKETKSVEMDRFQRTDAAKHRLYSTVYPQSGSTVAQTTIEFYLLRLQFSQALAS